MKCNCSVCGGKDYNKEGIEVFEKEVMPFIYTLVGGSPTSPFPVKYVGWVSSLAAYSQAIAYDRIHGNFGRKYFTSNKWMLKYKEILNNQFNIIVIFDEKDRTAEPVQEVCERGAETK